jgi:hypothetical protein
VTDDRGSSLLEVCGAMSVVAILAVMSVASTQAAPRSADDARARYSLHVAQVAIAAVDEPTLVTLSGAEPALEWTTNESVSADIVSMAVDPATGRVGLATRSISGRCWVLVTFADSNGTPIASQPNPQSCSGALALV